jgi:hypothetical protein
MRKQVVDVRGKATSYWPASSSLGKKTTTYWSDLGYLRKVIASYWPGFFSLNTAGGSVEDSGLTSTPVIRQAGDTVKGLQAGHLTLFIVFLSLEGYNCLNISKFFQVSKVARACQQRSTKYQVTTNLGFNQLLFQIKFHKIDTKTIFVFTRKKFFAQLFRDLERYEIMQRYSFLQI